jgi:hypothetical protein
LSGPFGAGPIIKSSGVTINAVTASSAAIDVLLAQGELSLGTKDHKN